MANERILKVTGKGNIKAKPDVTRITITLEGRNKEYDKTLEQSSKDTEALKDIMEKLGFDRSDIKTLRFNVNPRFESYQDKDKSWKDRFVGFEFNHLVKIEFDSDNTKLGKILYELANAKSIFPQFTISYTVKDKEASKNELLGKAVKDAKAKAVVLSSAAGVKLKDIINIDYSWGEIEFESSPMGRDLLCSTGAADNGSYNLDIEPDDIEVSDTVTVIWEIA